VQAGILSSLFYTLKVVCKLVTNIECVDCEQHGEVKNAYCLKKLDNFNTFSWYQYQ